MKNNSDDTLAVLTQCRNVWDRRTDGRTNNCIALCTASPVDSR